MTVADIVLRENNKWFPLPSVSVLTNETKGVTMHKIDALTAHAIAMLIEAGPLPLPYALACADIEGIYDPACVNGNLAGSNPTGNPLGFDMGICQLKLGYLMASEKLTVDDAREFAFDPKRAIPYFMRTMESDLAWADTVLPQMTDVWRNRYLLATCAYNFGRTGVAKFFGGPIPSHGQHVMDMERVFAADLNLPSVFP